MYNLKGKCKHKIQELILTFFSNYNMHYSSINFLKAPIDQATHISPCGRVSSGHHLSADLKNCSLSDSWLIMLIPVFSLWVGLTEGVFEVVLGCLNDTLFSV